MTIEPTLVVLFPFHKTQFVSQRRARTVVMITAIIAIAFSARLLVIPMDTAMIIGNFLTIVIAKRAVNRRHDLFANNSNQQNCKMDSTESQLMLMLLIVTLMFIVYFIPFTITNVVSRLGLPFDYWFTQKSFEGYTALRVLSALLKDSNFYTNFDVYCVSGRQFCFAFFSLLNVHHRRSTAISTKFKHKFRLRIKKNS
ncbi:unnamed protein product [Rotaria magnacalcarata]|uniref:G-protein coupled receptors family 1 profile domain-containing protein n=1 Tax=Rotaria magnacalcarata TaxID=392030 RepID=A0A816VP85_9BILA|nr:unnamed protein product [Rotaria magnacalcarata]